MEIGDLHIDVERKPIKHIHLAVYPPDGRVHVSAPLYLSDTDVEAFVWQKLAWITRNRTAILNQPRQTIRHYLSGESHYLFGQRLLLHVQEERGCTPSVRRMGERLILTARPNSSEARRAELVTEWQREHLRDYLNEAVPRWQQVMGEPEVTWQIKQMRSEWGSCQSRRRKLMFNLELARVPYECIDYIIVHELTHLQVPNHSRLFEARMERFLPQWRTRRQQLNDFVALYKTDSGIYTPQE